MTLNMNDLVEDVITYENSKKSAYANAIHKYEMLGFELSPLPKNKPPRLPAKGISKLGDSEIADLQSTFVRWMEYTGEQANLQHLFLNELSAQIDETVRKLKLKYSGSISEREDRAKIHPTVVKLTKKLLETKALYSLLKGKYEVFDKARGVCSRDVERRRKDFLANSNEDSIRGIRSRSKVRKKGPMRQRDLEVGRGE